MNDADVTSGIASAGTSDKAQPETVALFISDLHLCEAMPRTTQKFLDFLQHAALQAKQLYLLGDIFEYWAGDDDLATPYNHIVAQTIRAASDTGLQIFWMAGNRDFLAGAQFAATCGLTLLPDPYLLEAARQRILLTHGDAYCTDDHAYMQFRSMVRQPEWQQNFLSMPLAKRKEIIEGLRQGSRAAQQTKSMEIMDVNQAAIADLFDKSQVALMIHGHTHRPARHVDAQQRVRYVLPDWDADNEPRRGGWLVLMKDGMIMECNVNSL